jgi:hypothetical protein
MVRPLFPARKRPASSSSDGEVAQLVEQRTENPRVVGSIPTLATIPELVYRVACNSNSTSLRHAPCPFPNVNLYSSGFCPAAGLGCLLIGSLVCLVAAYSFLKSANYPVEAERNQKVVQQQWNYLALDPVRSRAMATGLSTSALILARTNQRVKLALVGVSLLLAGANGLLWVSGKQS